MDNVPRTAEDYGPEDLRQVKAGCLEVATRLGDLLNDLVIVGGLVPALLVVPARAFPTPDSGIPPCRPSVRISSPAAWNVAMPTCRPITAVGISHGSKHS